MCIASKADHKDMIFVTDDTSVVYVDPISPIQAHLGWGELGMGGRPGHERRVVSVCGGTTSTHQLRIRTSLRLSGLEDNNGLYVALIENRLE